MKYNYTVNYMNYTTTSCQKLTDIEDWCIGNLPLEDHDITKGDDGKFYYMHVHINTPESAMAYKLRWDYG